MRYNVGDKVRVVGNVATATHFKSKHGAHEFPVGEIVTIKGYEGGAFRCVGDNDIWWVHEDDIDLAPLTEGQDEQNQLWEEVEFLIALRNSAGAEAIHTKDEAGMIIHKNLCDEYDRKLKQSFTIKRK